MNFSDIADWLTDERLLAHLIGAHLILGAILATSIAMRKVLIHGGDNLVRWLGLHWLDGVSKEATRRMRSLLFWTTLGLMVAVVAGAVAYHFAGRDIRTDLKEWYAHLTAGEILAFGLAVGELVLLAFGMMLASRLVRRARSGLEARARQMLPQPDATAIPRAANGAPASGEAAPGEAAPGEAAFDHKKDQEETIKRWFFLLERFALITVVLTGFWIAGNVVHLQHLVNHVIGFLIRMLAIVMVARLLILACRTISHSLASLGNKHLGDGKFQRYWQQVTRLFPFGEKCFEAAIHISAASLIVRELEFIRVVADLGPRIVECIGIFFVTRVLIELLTVLLNEAFGMYEENRQQDQKGQTLVPLLQSISQYVLYFGSGVIMMSALGIDTRPILAGAGILGLAGGLGAQSLVTDVVSGFFILFENQYLVGDVVQIGDAAGRVEAVSIRHTQVRDEQGKLYIIPNGQIKSVINFSKGYVNAVVDIKAPTSANLDQVMRDMAEAGKLLRQTRREVIGETVIKGLVELSPTDMTIRAVTKVMPGSHQSMQNEYRRLLKTVFDRSKEPLTMAA